MPPRGRDPNVAPYYDELWSFLRARVTGALPPGPVERLPRRAYDEVDGRRSSTRTPIHAARGAPGPTK